MPEQNEPGYEVRDLSPRAIAWFAGGLSLVLLLTFLGVHAFQSSLERAHPGASPGWQVSGPTAPVPPPRLQVAPATETAALHAAQAAKLETYGWVDRRAGIIRLPIERAMQLTAERGLPARPAPKGAQP